MGQSVAITRPLAVASSARLFVVLWGGLVVVDGGRAVHAPPLVQTSLLAALAVACSWGQRHLAALACASTTWLVTTGFVVNSLGELRVTGWGDVARLAVLVTVCLVGTEFGR